MRSMLRVALKKILNQKRCQIPEEHSGQYDVKVEYDSEWSSAKPYSEIPSISKLRLMRYFMPGGKFYNLHYMDVNKIIYKDYGAIVKFPALLGNPDMVFCFDPKDIENIFRTEGQFPIRRGLDTFDYYRKKYRPEIFNVGGLVSDQGEAWAKLRTAINPIIMKQNVLKPYIPETDKVTIDLINNIRKMRDKNDEMPDDFMNELSKWSLESIGVIALERRLGLLTTKVNENLQLIEAVKTFFKLSFELDVQPSIWKYCSTPKFKEMMNAYDVMTNIAIKNITYAIEASENEPKKYDDHEESVLKKILRLNRQYALVMAMDVLLAGVDTTASAAAGILYNLAMNQRVQEKLREEVITKFPDANASLTPESLNNLPYTRACVKESLRMTPVIVGNVRCVGRNMVLHGYQIPKGTDCVMGSATLQHTDEYVERSSEFIPERFLKDVPTGCPNAKNVHPFILLPFGFGARACIGKRIAEMDIEILLIRLLREFKVEWNYGPLEFAKSVVVTPVTNLKFKISNL